LQQQLQPKTKKEKTSMNRNNGHTGGDWQYERDGLDFEIYADGAATPSGEISLAVVFNGWDHSEGEAEANARLMVAAPELFEALRELVERDRAEAAESGFTEEEMTWLENGRRVLAKATAA
jgi:hypothetical protein